MESATLVQILDEAVYISIRFNAIGKGTRRFFLNQLWVNTKADQSGRRKTLNSNHIYSALKN